MAEWGINKQTVRPVLARALTFGWAIASVMGALLLELLFAHYRLPHAFTAFALSAIAISFWYGGTKPGIVAMLLAIMIRSYLFEAEIPTLSRVLYDLVFVTLKIERTEQEGSTIFVLSGRFEAQHTEELEGLFKREKDRAAVVLDLQEVRLADRGAVQFLARSESGGVRLVNCPA